MPPFSVDDYHKLLQKIAVLETKIHRLEGNVEVNGQYGNDTTLPWNQNSGQDNANTRLVSTTEKREGRAQVNISTNYLWNSHGARPENKLPHCDMGRQVTGRAQRSEICDATGWPALPSRGSASSTPTPSRRQPWTAAKGRNINMPPQQPCVQLENRFAPMLQDPGSPPDNRDNLPSAYNRVRAESNSESKRLQSKLMARPQTLIVGDSAVKDIRSLCNKNTKGLCFPKDMVSDMREKILDIVISHPSVKKQILHIGSNDIVKQQSEVLKQDFTDLLNIVSCLNTEVFSSGPLPPIRKGVEKFSRLLSLYTWLSTACNVNSVHFIDNFNFFWDRRHLFKEDGLCLKRIEGKTIPP
ncbi:uncharacterized protein LOC118313818 [Scophthalmus maximus]|uniref:uncharacterized protein LOC118313818 n=1 Tax=Scophthalmus maximus TaxID=52904 RepID=UPI001FA8D445|nr:uncharacterized protein LOC118313818 [Scophthalmus maximus]XP_035495623.2 uncharacterized protein LOC118313818 [Scophthalmus maximus]